MTTPLLSSIERVTETVAGILHIGVGNFHRAHQAFYTDQLMKKGAAQGWGICGAMLLPSDEKLYKALTSQNNQYTLTICGRDGVDEVCQVSSIVELLWAGEDHEAILNKIADPAIRILSLTITEGGYNIDKSTGTFLLDEANIAADIANPQGVKTVFGTIAEGLRRRMKAGAGPLTLMSCDNLQHNGDTASYAFNSFFAAQDAELAAWAAENVSYPNSMVDRITPATRPEDIERLNARHGTQDAAPVYCEDFIQWVIEDKFLAGRPAWEDVGAEMTDDVTDFEKMKLSLLNASHTLLSYPSFLSGYRKVDEAMHDERIVKFVRSFMDEDITPLLTAPANTDLELYKQTLVERFANRSVSDQIARLCYDGLSKFPVYVMPNLARLIAEEKDLTRVAYLIAAYRHYLKVHTDDTGANFEVAEPWMNPADEAAIASNDTLDFLALSAFSSVDLRAVPAFVSQYEEMLVSIASIGAMATLEAKVLS